MIKTRVRDSDRMLVLLDMLRTRFDHPTAKECFLDMSNRVPGVGQSTVYRHLTKLVTEGLIQELRVDDGPARFDAGVNCHAHFYCNECKSMLDVIDVKISGQMPGRVQEFSYIAKGVCDNCQLNLDKK